MIDQATLRRLEIHAMFANLDGRAGLHEAYEAAQRERQQRHAEQTAVRRALGVVRPRLPLEERMPELRAAAEHHFAAAAAESAARVRSRAPRKPWRPSAEARRKLREREREKIRQLRAARPARPSIPPVGRPPELEARLAEYAARNRQLRLKSVSQ